MIDYLIGNCLFGKFTSRSMGRAREAYLEAFSPGKTRSSNVFKKNYCAYPTIYTPTIEVLLI